MHIQTLTLYTPQPERLKTFYAQLGFVVQETPEGLEVQAGASILRFEHSSTATGGFHFAFHVPEHLVQQAFEQLASRVEVLPIPEEASQVAHFVDWNAHAFYFLDPDGNIAECIGRHNLDHSSHSTVEILGISEVGVVSDDVLHTVDHLTSALQLQPFRPPSDSFSPVGDEQGLWIVARHGRIWFPTHQPAQILPFEAVVSTAGGTFRVKGTGEGTDLHIEPL